MVVLVRFKEFEQASAADFQSFVIADFYAFQISFVNPSSDSDNAYFKDLRQLLGTPCQQPVSSPSYQSVI